MLRSACLAGRKGGGFDQGAATKQRHRDRIIGSHFHKLQLGAVLTASTLLLGGPAPAQAQAAARPFDPVAFFSGRTEGVGTLDEVMASPVATHVTGMGALQANGVFVIDQTVKVTGKPVEHRRWQLRQTAPGKFSGTISDAKGPVTGVVTGNRMRIGYTMRKGGMKVDQVLTLAPDGKSLSNSMKVRKLGILVATMVETIRKT